MRTKIQKSATMVAIAMVTSVATAQGISVTVDGKAVHFNNGGPRSVQGRVMVPLRGVFEQMGASVNWDAANRDVNASRNGKSMRLHIGDREANVGGQPVTMDVPAMIMNGATMVPIRFLSETLGAQVKWNESERLVAISTNGEDGDTETSSTLRDQKGRVRNRAGQYQDDDGVWHNARTRWQDQNGTWHEVRGGRQTNGSQTNGRAQTIAGTTVLPVTLDNALSSSQSEPGERFTATVRSTGNDYYGMLPDGTKVQGTVVTSRAQSGRDPGLLELSFEELRLPNGRTYPITGSLVSLTAAGVVRDADGRIRATEATTDKRGVFAGYGAGAGLIVGLLTKKPIEGTILGGVLGYIAGQVQKDKADKPSNVRLEPGTQFGVLLARPVTLLDRDIRSR
ncbi:stalk domain-containing protein [Fimbriimonas ginsengisoli]|uniref:Copper amine oxidase-like protein n=1 Tax=Fimbriimonas ginsengisoli Gsoil 348 TaxID=661478 RepID=A0A068NPC9_FIMGI|nr:stalk domain-containing protein [Fimbriimonas ginsengisoli]AIE84570.1 copper amine oxidase-like protein [Fimbriimonas ginsengisoli Gsoil 348]